jgi:uncharacterized protein
MDLEKVQVDIVGLTTSPASGGAYALLLKEVEGTRQLPIIIGAYEAQSIALEMEGIKPPRPLTHDLLKNIIDTMGSEVLEVTISELKEGTFYASILMDNQLVDSRPSDAIALAVRCGIPIYVAEKVMQEAAFIPESDEEKKYLSNSKDISTNKAKRLDILQKQLKDAIEREDYEIAARLRDEIKKLQISDI